MTILYSKLNVKIETKGVFNTKDFRIYYKKNNKLISPWHQISLFNKKDNTYNMICEIPKYTRVKMEIDTKEKYNPIKQDIKDGKLREYKWGDMLFNYGALPKTWEDPNHISTATKKKGDNDPLDIIDIGTSKIPMGIIYKVKVLGVLGMIDENETDWKIIAINKKDSLYKKINDINDIDIYLPGVLDAIYNWFRKYKTSRGKPLNKFAFNGKFKNKDYAVKIINTCNKLWKNKYSSKKF